MKFIFASVVLMMTVMNSKAQYWEPLGGGVSGFGVAIFDLAVDTFHNLLWAGGRFEKAGDVEANNLAVWDGVNWHALSTEPSGPIAALTMKKDTLIYATGADGNYETGMYVDTTFIGTLGNLFTPNCLYVYHDTILAGGGFTGGIKYWDGNNWKVFHGGVDGFLYQVHSMGEYNGELIVGGRFSEAGSVAANNIASWNGSEWHALGDGITSDNSYVYAVQEYNGELYVGGDFEEAGGILCDGISKWDSEDWDSVGAYGCGAVYDMFVEGDRLYASGTMLKNLDYCLGDRVAVYDGVDWDNLFLSNDGYSFTIALYNNQIIASSDLTVTSFGDTVNSLGRYIGFPVYLNEDPSEVSSTFFPNPTSSTILLRLLSSHPSTLYIFNLLGEKMKEEKVSGNKVTIDVSELPAGLYFVRTNETTVGKFVKE